jgi:hypothetical protein
MGADASHQGTPSSESLNHTNEYGLRALNETAQTSTKPSRWHA